MLHLIHLLCWRFSTMLTDVYKYFFPQKPLNVCAGHKLENINTPIVSFGRCKSHFNATIPLRYQGLNAKQELYLHNPKGLKSKLLDGNRLFKGTSRIILNANIEDIPECLSFFSKPTFKHVSLDADLLATLNKEKLLELFENIQEKSYTYTREAPLVIDVNLDAFYQNHSLEDVQEIRNNAHNFNSPTIQLNVVVGNSKIQAYIAAGKNHLLFTQSDNQRKASGAAIQPEMLLELEEVIMSFL